MDSRWEPLGKQVAFARAACGLTQAELAERMDLDRTAISKIEAGARAINTLELARLAKELGVSIQWFLREPPPTVVSRRSESKGHLAADALLEELACDVEQLISMGLLNPAESAPWKCASIDDAARVAREVRQAVGLAEDDPARDLVRRAEKLGLYAFVLPVADALVDGSYVALARGGVALINGGKDCGRRRFTLVHELGHHVFQDAYAADWTSDGGASESEKVINAFAIHFLLPAGAVRSRWDRYSSKGDRNAAICIAAELGASWSATCAQLARLGLIMESRRGELVERNPAYAEYVELEVRIDDDLEVPMVPPGYEAAVFRAVNKGKLSRVRGLELLRAAVVEQDLPGAQLAPLESMRAEFDVFSE